MLSDVVLIERGTRLVNTLANLAHKPCVRFGMHERVMLDQIVHATKLAVAECAHVDEGRMNVLDVEMKVSVVRVSLVASGTCVDVGREAFNNMFHVFYSRGQKKATIVAFEYERVRFVAHLKIARFLVISDLMQLFDSM